MNGAFAAVRFCDMIAKNGPKESHLLLCFIKGPLTFDFRTFSDIWLFTREARLEVGPLREEESLHSKIYTSEFIVSSVFQDTELFKDHFLQFRKNLPHFQCMM